MRVKRAASASGQILPMVALLMVVIMGMAAFAIDGSNIYSQHRRLQADLDVAVKVAASQMFDFDPSSAAYTDTARTAISSAAQLLAEDGFTNTLTISNSAGIQPIGGDYHNGFCGTDSAAGITLCNPPRSGAFAGAPHFDFVEGSLSRNVGGFFGGTIGLGTLHISVRAVGWHGGFHQPYALIGLNQTPGNCTVDDSGGTGTVVQIDGSLVGDANTCGGTAPTVTGHSDEHGSGNTNQIVGQSGTNQSVPVVTDPFTPTVITTTAAVTAVPNTTASIPSECAAEVHHDIPTLSVADILANNLPASTTFYFPPADGTPGLPPIGGNMQGNAGTFYFMPRCDGSPEGQPAVYLLDYLHTPGKIFINSFNSVLVYDSGVQTALLKTTGQSNWALNAPTSGPYQGIALTQTRSPCPATPNTVDFLGGGGGKGAFSVTGVVDLPCSNITASGDSTVNIHGVLVGYDVTTSGSTTFDVTYNPNATPPDKGSVLVE